MTVKRRVGFCPVCRLHVSINRNGLVASHRGEALGDRKGCPGSGQPEYKEETRS
jgi:hypothetical protein